LKKVVLFSKELEKKVTKETEKDLLRNIEKQTPVITGNLLRKFKGRAKDNIIKISNRAPYWNYVNFGPHSTKSLHFTER